MVSYNFGPGPSFQPKNGAEIVAQAVIGEVQIDEQKKLFLHLEGYAARTIIINKRLAVLGAGPGKPQVPLFNYYAGWNHGVIVPFEWDEASVRSVPTGPNQVSDWLGTLTRVFGQRTSCKEFEVKSKVLPGFEVIPPEPGKH